MKKHNTDQKLINIKKQLFAKASSAVLVQGTVGDWFHTLVGVRQGCLLSPTLFNTLLEHMTDALEEHHGTVCIRGRVITNLRLADDIGGLAGKEQELANLVNRLEKTFSRYGRDVSAENTKLITNSTKPIEKITISEKELETESVQVPWSYSQ